MKYSIYLEGKKIAEGESCKINIVNDECFIQSEKHLYEWDKLTPIEKELKKPANDYPYKYED